jgi:hypothetical protein
MARNLLDLANSLEKRAKEIDKRVNIIAIKVAMNLLENLVWRTPVDTSRALSNWQVSFDTPNLASIEPYVPGYLGYTQQASASEAINVGNMILKQKKPGQVIYISNAVPYIGDLNRGSSKQAPAGIVDGAMMIARRYMPTVKY